MLLLLLLRRDARLAQRTTNHLSDDSSLLMDVLGGGSERSLPFSSGDGFGVLSLHLKRAGMDVGSNEGALDMSCMVEIAVVVHVLGWGGEGTLDLSCRGRGGVVRGLGRGEGRAED